MPRTSVKGQVLANLVAEFAKTPFEEKGEKQNMDGKSVGMVSLQEPLPWKVHVDGATNQRGSGVGLVIISPEKIIIEKFLKLGFGRDDYGSENGWKGSEDVLRFEIDCRPGRGRVGSQRSQNAGIFEPGWTFTIRI